MVPVTLHCDNNGQYFISLEGQGASCPVLETDLLLVGSFFMNREFIYRIWSIKEKKYVMTGSLYGVVGTTHLTCCFNRRYHTIEEYTGLNDLNGQRIFENDIL